MFMPIAAVAAASLGAAVLLVRSPLGRAVRLQFDRLAEDRDDFDRLESHDEPVPAWLRPGGPL